MGAMAFQITSLTSVCSAVYSMRRSNKHQSSASLAFVQMASNAENVSNWWRHHESDVSGLRLVLVLFTCSSSLFITIYSQCWCSYWKWIKQQACIVDSIRFTSLEIAPHWSISTVECRYNAVQNSVILRTSLQLLVQSTNQTYRCWDLSHSLSVDDQTNGQPEWTTHFYIHVYFWLYGQGAHFAKGLAHKHKTCKYLLF